MHRALSDDVDVMPICRRSFRAYSVEEPDQPQAIVLEEGFTASGWHCCRSTATPACPYRPRLVRTALD